MTRSAIDLFPRLEPMTTDYLDVGDGHQVYWEQSGNPDGIPVVFLHGGPGAGANPSHRRFFNPAFYRIIILDQRGSGRSKPFASITNNSTHHLIDDLEKLRIHLGIEKWMVFGGSWGSTLALAYAIAHPQNCLGLVLRGIFLGTQPEVDWFLYGMRAVFPEAWHTFSTFLPEQERDDLLASYHRRLTDPDPNVHMPAADVWSSYESQCSTLLPSRTAQMSAGQAGLSLARIEAHFFVNNTFLAPNHILSNLDRIRALPAVIVQGRYDMVCPIKTADALSNAWPEAEYVIVPDAGHSAMEPGIRSELVKATERMRGLVAS